MVLLGSVGAGAALLTLPLAGAFWEHFPLARYAQFPWRALGLAGFGLAAAAGGIGRVLQRRPVLLAVALLAAVVPALPLVCGADWSERYRSPSVADVVRYEL